MELLALAMRFGGPLRLVVQRPLGNFVRSFSCQMLLAGQLIRQIIELICVFGVFVRLLRNFLRLVRQDRGRYRRGSLS